MPTRDGSSLDGSSSDGLVFEGPLLGAATLASGGNSMDGSESMETDVTATGEAAEAAALPVNGCGGGAESSGI
jgi:hypothetical protein